MIEIIPMQRFSRYRKNVLMLQYRNVRQNVVALRYVTRFRNVMKSLHCYNKIEIIELFLFLFVAILEEKCALFVCLAE